MDPKLAQRIAKEEMWEKVGYSLRRRQAVAQVAVSKCDSLIVAGKIIREFEAYIFTHLGRNAYGTTLYKRCKVADHKHRQSKRRDATQNTFAHNVDLHRAWLRFRSHFVKGGKLYANMSRSQKRDYRSAIHHADLHLRKYGDYVGAFEIVKGK